MPDARSTRNYATSWGLFDLLIGKGVVLPRAGVGQLDLIELFYVVRCEFVFGNGSS